MNSTFGNTILLNIGIFCPNSPIWNWVVPFHIGEGVVTECVDQERGTVRRIGELHPCLEFTLLKCILFIQEDPPFEGWKLNESVDCEDVNILFKDMLFHLVATVPEVRSKPFDVWTICEELVVGFLVLKSFIFKTPVGTTGVF